ncbi:hypothetical protein A6F59_24460 [Prescottella equi]|nr:hypothetical protein A6F59_24460 [Prescottella equi]
MKHPNAGEVGIAVTYGADEPLEGFNNILVVLECEGAWRIHLEQFTEWHRIGRRESVYPQISGTEM